jgi:hypothetical protein
MGYVKQFDNRQTGGGVDPAASSGPDVNNYQLDQFIILLKPATKQKQQHM